MRCSFCGQVTPDNTQPCPHCGKKRDADGPQEPLDPLNEEETQVLKTVFSRDETQQFQADQGPRRALIEVYGPQGELVDWHELPDAGSITIGRGSDQRIRIPDLTVSRRHAQIRIEKGKFWVVDIGSLNDTHLNEERVQGEQELFEGARLTVGMHTLVFIYR